MHQPSFEQADLIPSAFYTYFMSFDDKIAFLSLNLICLGLLHLLLPHWLHCLLYAWLHHAGLHHTWLVHARLHHDGLHHTCLLHAWLHHQLLGLRSHYIWLIYISNSTYLPHLHLLVVYRLIFLLLLVISFHWRAEEWQAATETLGTAKDCLHDCKDEQFEGIILICRLILPVTKA